MDLILAYGAGILTLINPCILPVLPIVLATALQSSRWGPAALAAGMSASFVALGLAVAAAGRGLGLGEDAIIRAAAVMMLGFGLILMVPRFSAGFAAATAGVASHADAGFARIDQGGLRSQFLGGALLGAVWSPCVGPTLGGAIGLASQGDSLGLAATIMAGFALGVSTVILALGHGARGFFRRRHALMQAIATRSRPILGAVFVAVALSILTGLSHVIEAFAVERMPIWLQDLSVRI